MINTYSIITDIEQRAENIFAVVLRDEKIAKEFKPGQFVMLHVEPGSYYPLLRRAFSISRIIDDEHYELLIKQVGLGTSLLRKKMTGRSVGIIGPLGNGFDLENAKDKDVILVAGGIGIAPLFFLYEKITALANSVQLYYGTRDAGDMVNTGVMSSSCYYVTENGSLGTKGYVTSLLEEKISSGQIRKENTYIYACGPNPMLNSLAKLTEKYEILCEISVESMMACGMGVCMGCPVELKNEPGKYKYVCKDGPVFNINDIVL